MRRTRFLLAAALGGALLAAPGTIAASSSASTDPAAQAATATPIKHLVVIYQENISFDHYFGTYPHALNPPGEPPFEAAPDTPTVNGLCGPATGAPGPSPTNPPCDTQSALLTSNPNLDNPQRLDRTQALTCDMDHNYNDEQSAFDHGLLDMFVQKTRPFGNTQNNGTLTCDAAQVMDYYDGNTVTALWNYAQHFAMSDNSYSTTFGPSTPGALNLISGNTFGAVCGDNPTQVFNGTACTAKPYNTAAPAPTPPQGTGTVFGDARPNFDKCSVGRTQAQMGGRNIGDLLNAAPNLTWGWFQGGFDESCTKTTPPTGGATAAQNAAAANFDYIPHHEPFQYYASTANPNHLPPTSPQMIGHTDQANHQYDLTDFWAAVDAGNLPAVSFLKAPGYQDGHAGYSTPLDEQHFVVNTINRLEKTAFWHTTAVVIAYDDSDGWYDHQMGLIQVQSQSPWDTLSNPGECGTNSNGHQSPPPATQQPAGASPQLVRCGLGMRQPLLVISPFARHNFVDHTLTDQSSILRFIEDNWLGGERIGQGSTDAIAGTIKNMFDFDNPPFERLFLDPITGEKTPEPVNS